MRCTCQRRYGSSGSAAAFRGCLCKWASALPHIGLWRAVNHWRRLHFALCRDPVFTASVRRLLDEEQYRALQLALLLRPEQGQLIPGGAGLRQIRGGADGRGKSGGVRTIYYWAVEEHVCCMLYVYAKNEQGNLTPAQTKALARLVREESK